MNEILLVFVGSLAVFSIILLVFLIKRKSDEAIAKLKKSLEFKLNRNIELRILPGYSPQISFEA